MKSSEREQWTEKYGGDQTGTTSGMRTKNLFSTRIAKPNKYRNKKCEYDGYTFDSIKEMNRYIQLRELEKAGKIRDLELQIYFELVPKCGKERKAFYVADFVYYRDGKMVVEDVKSPSSRTPLYILKRKIMLWRNNIEVQEI